MSGPNSAQRSDAPADAVADFIRVRGDRPRWSGVAPALRPRTVDEGYRLQKAVHERLEASGTRRVGYKVGATSKAGQQYFGIDEPTYAGIFENTRMKSLADIMRAGLVEPSVECEVAVILGTDIDASADTLGPAMIADAISACHIACEIIDNRYGDPLAVGVPSLLVDDFFNAGFVLGADNPQWRTLDLRNLNGSIRIDGVTASGNSADILDALTSVQWLAKKLAQAGRRLRAGEIVLTGSIVVPTRLDPQARSLVLSIEGFRPLDLGAER